MLLFPLQAILQHPVDISEFGRGDYHHAPLGGSLPLFLLPLTSSAKGIIHHTPFWLREVIFLPFFEPPDLLQSNYTFGPEGVEEDKSVRELSIDLKDIDLVMVAVLSQDKYRYLFEGVGHLVASIFISSTNHIKIINSNGIKKMWVGMHRERSMFWMVCNAGLVISLCFSHACLKSHLSERENWTRQENTLKCSTSHLRYVK